MNILLIDPGGWQKGSINLGLAYLAAGLLKNKHNVKILDMNSYCYDLKRSIEIFTPQIIGYSVKTANVKLVRDISNYVEKEFSGILQVAGGPHVSLCFNEFLIKNPQIDFSFLN
ncbi:MAG: cobalamin B12-binding domain-containing protein, partial [Candidatus Omnitrophica bacterium]|nr:cobalamin B12-binding domain-containing protein [Candidatus Omnitrophota bacterium]